MTPRLHRRPYSAFVRTSPASINSPGTSGSHTVSNR
jgi:hypothetical protein